MRKKESLRHIHFAEDELVGKDYINTEFIGCRFLDAKTEFTSFTGCNFRFCDFSGIILEKTSFIGCSFPESKMNNLNFSETLIRECNFTSAILTDSFFQQLKAGSKNDRKKLDLRKCVFSESQLGNSVFYWCDLQSVSFWGSNLERVVFEKCNLEDTDFTEANIGGTIFENSNIKNTILDVSGFIQYGQSKGFKLNQ